MINQYLIRYFAVELFYESKYFRIPFWFLIHEMESRLIVASYPYPHTFSLDKKNLQKQIFFPC